MDANDQTAPKAGIQNPAPQVAGLRQTSVLGIRL